ncbi:DNA-binding protein [Aureibacter tunicatorum]|nr:DNA-binding protein [Aureibacter tunicatorum]
MKDLKDFNINIVNLKEGTHQYDFIIEDSFFKNFDHSLTDKGSLKIDLTLEKTSNVIAANFHIEGFVELICDRSLEAYEYNLKSDRKILFKFSESEQESNDEIIFLHPAVHEYNFSTLCYEFIMLEIPFKKLHPKYQDEEEWEDGERLIYSSETASEEIEEKEENKSDSEAVDPRWEALKKLSNNKEN